MQVLEYQTERYATYRIPSIRILSVSLSNLYFQEIGARQRATTRQKDLGTTQVTIESTEQGDGQGQGWGGLVMKRASFSLGRQALAHRRTLIPSTLLRGTPRAEPPCARFIFNTVCVASLLPRTMYFAPTADPPRFPMPSRSRGCI